MILAILFRIVQTKFNQQQQQQQPQQIYIDIFFLNRNTMNSICL